MSAITWNRKKVWGSVGMTHYAETEIDGSTYRFTIDQPRRGQWIGRGWLNGSMFLYRDSADLRTLQAMKDEISRVVGGLRNNARKAAAK